MKKLLFITLLFVYQSTLCQTIKTVTSDNFESETLGSIWRTDKFIEGAMTIQSEIVRSGKKACKLTLRSGDQIEKEKGTKFERAELREKNELMINENERCVYSFSLFIPEDFPIVETRLVIAQWKQNCSGNCDPDNPVIAVRFESGRLFITLQNNFERKTLFEYNGNPTGKWLDFKFDVCFSRTDSGILSVDLNNRKIIGYKGATAYSEKYGYQAGGKLYFKTGLYRDKMSQTMTIYIDDYKKELIQKE